MQRHGNEVVLATNDKDLYQLAGSCGESLHDGKADLASPKDAFALLGEDQSLPMGSSTEAYGDVLALTGDFGGPHSRIDWAANGGGMIREFGGLEPLLANVEKFRACAPAKSSPAPRSILQNRKMIDLDCHLELPCHR